MTDRTRRAALRAAAGGAALWLLGRGGALAQGEPDWSKAVPVTVRMTEYRFDPAHLSFRHGVAYRLHLENRGAELHEFTAREFFAAILIRNRDVFSPGGGDIVVRPGEQKDLFFVARQPGRYPLSCADHDWAGMVGEIIVE